MTSSTYIPPEVQGLTGQVFAPTRVSRPFPTLNIHQLLEGLSLIEITKVFKNLIDGSQKLLDNCLTAKGNMVEVIEKILEPTLSQFTATAQSNTDLWKTERS